MDFDDQFIRDISGDEVLEEKPPEEPPDKNDDGEVETPPVDGSEETSSGEELSEYGTEFLTHVPEEDRATVAKYLSPWDAGAQRKFREYQEEITTWENLGEKEEVERGTFLLTQLRDRRIHNLSNSLIYIHRLRL